MVSQHYENFPVASFLLPKNYRLPVAIIYAFARTADDMADELALPDNERLSALNDFEQELTNAIAGNSQSDLLNSVAYVIATYNLPAQLFYDLLTAFKQDTQQTRYNTFDDVLNYCQHSANPVGRLLLHLFHFDDDNLLILSDKICTALQLINFLQDYQQDYQENNRIYFPLAEFEKYGISEQEWIAGNTRHKLKPFMHFQIKRTRQLLQSGAQLGNILPGRLGWEIRAIYQSGMTVLDKLEHANTTFSRPRINISDKLMILIKSLFKLSVVKNDT